MNWSRFDLYGPDARNRAVPQIVFARRLAERGVRLHAKFFIPINHHSRFIQGKGLLSRIRIKPVPVSITPKAAMGMPDDTLVVWGGEFAEGVAGQGGRIAEAIAETITPDKLAHAGGGGVRSWV